jgi:uncharacterized delta-60 repeat protein
MTRHFPSARAGIHNPCMKRALVALVLSLLVPFASGIAQAAKPGQLDRSFGDDGKVRGDGCAHGSGQASVAIDAHQRIVTADTDHASQYFCVARHSRSGGVDRSFGHGGLVRVKFDDLASARSVALDRKLIVAAGGYGTHGAGGFSAARLRPNGTLDPAFGDEGTVTTDFGGRHDAGFAVAIDSHRRVIVAGYTYSNGDTDFAVARFKWNGDLDSSFGGDGKVTTDFGAVGDYARSVAIDSHDRVVVAGYSQGGSRRANFALARYRSNGQLDPSFGTGGTVITDFGGGGGAAAVTIDSRGRIVAAGSAPAAQGDFALARFKPDGSLNPSFGHGGEVVTNLPHNGDGVASVAIDSRNRIVAVGGAGSVAIARYRATGALDRSFGRGGKKVTRFSMVAWSAAIDSRGRIVVAASHAALMLLRYIGYRGPR